MNTRRGSPLWLFSRIGILVVFVIMPFYRIHYHIKYRAFQERFDYCISNGYYAVKVQNLDAANMWQAQADIEILKFYGHHTNN